MTFAPRQQGKNKESSTWPMWRCFSQTLNLCFRWFFLSHFTVLPIRIQSFRAVSRDPPVDTAQCPHKEQGTCFLSTFFLAFRDGKHPSGKGFMNTAYTGQGSYLYSVPGNNLFINLSWARQKLLLLSSLCFNSLHLSSLPHIPPRYSTDHRPNSIPRSSWVNQ